jgi:hypothetical protein
MSELVLRDIGDLPRLVSIVHDHFDESSRPMQIKIVDKRTLSANAQIHVWAQTISEYTGEDIKTTHSRLKRDHALPIILADPEYGPKIDYMLKGCKFDSLSDSQQLGFIELLPISRLFSTKQHNAYRDSVQARWNAEGLYIDYLQGDQ